MLLEHPLLMDSKHFLMLLTPLGVLGNSLIIPLSTPLYTRCKCAMQGDILQIRGACGRLLNGLLLSMLHLNFCTAEMTSLVTLSPLTPWNVLVTSLVWSEVLPSVSIPNTLVVLCTTVR